MRILLVEGNLDDAALAREALLEIEESRRWRPWIGHLDLVHLERMEDALTVLAEEPFDVAVVAAGVAGAGGLAPLFSLRAQAPDLPVILLVSDADDLLAASAVREGADDCISKSDLDCAPLARALRHAVERRRRASAQRHLVLLDGETGLYNRTGFLAAGERDRKLARRLQRPLSLVVAEAAGDAPEPEELAVILHLSFLDTDLVARLDARRFAILSLGGDDRRDVSASLAAMRFRLVSRNRRRHGEPPLEVRLGTASLGPAQDASLEELLDLAQSALCENGPSEPVAGSPARHATA
jgi:PleD family two-component response regulator